MKTIPTFVAQIFIGRREGYDGPIRSTQDIRKICQAYVDKVGFCVTVTETQFIYSFGNEPGVIVGIINYPRFPLTPEEIKSRTRDLAELLRFSLNQQRVSVVFSDETIMIEEEAT